MPPKAADPKKDVIQKDPSCKVKNTFLEFGDADDGAGYWKRRTRSLDDEHKVKHSPLVVASKSPQISPALGPMDGPMQAVPIDEVQFELLEEAADASENPIRPAADGGGQIVAQSAGGIGREEPAYVVPTTPSPFLHSAVPPFSGSAVPPFGSFAPGYDLGLPPAFEQDGELGMDEMGMSVQGMDMEGMPFQGMPFLPEMYDPNYGQYMGFTWSAMPVDGEGNLAAGGGVGMLEDPTASAQQGAQGQAAVEGAAAPTAEAGGADGTVERPGQRESRRGKGRRDGREEEQRSERPPRGAEKGGGGEASSPAEKARPRNDCHEEQEIQGDYTTVMLRNIPNKYTREMLIKQLSLSFHGEFDFMYLPIDFKNKCNVGYSFINFRTQDACERFISQFHGVDVRKCLPGLNSRKVVEVTPARVQGLAENVRRLRNSPVMNQLRDHPEWMPLIFNDVGEEQPFPTPDQPLPPVKPRGRNRDANAGE